MCDMTHSYVRHGSFVCATWLIHMCDISMRVIWLIFRRDTYICMMVPPSEMFQWHVWHDSFRYATRLKHMCELTHTREWHDSCTCVTWLMHMCDVHSSPWITCTICRHDSSIRVIRLMHMCDILHLHVWHQSPNNMHQEPPSTLMRRIYMWKSYTCVQWHIHRCEMTLKWLIPMCRRRCWSRKYRHQPRSSGGGSRWWWLALLEWAGRCCPWAL